MEKSTLHIQKLYSLIEGMDESQCSYYGKRCAVALETENHTIGVEIEINKKQERTFVLDWVSPEETNSFKEPKKNVELGAVAVSLLLVLELTEYAFVTEACQGDGVDYWLGYPVGHEKYDDYNFAQARIEISGIKEESSGNTLEKRAKEKIK